MEKPKLNYKILISLDPKHIKMIVFLFKIKLSIVFLHCILLYMNLGNK